MDNTENKSRVIELTADIVSAFVANNSLAANDLPTLIKQTYDALTGISTSVGIETPAEKPAPAVPLRKAVQPDFVTDLFTGKRFKSLKRHLRTVHNMSPDEYRAYWGLPKDSPMVAPNYAKARSDLAKSSGLGQRRKAASSAPKARAKA